METYEKLGAFYLGRTYDLAHKKPTNELLLYESKDLLTHGVCVGMTGSGKTGLCLDILEEAAIDGIPVIAIDPKGDIGNLLLTFPRLQPADFEPWVDADEARRNGQSVQQFAAQQAELWKNGLAEWDQDGSRIERLRQSAEFAIYTPGSSAGIPVSILNSMAAPPDVVLDDSDALQERITGTTAGLLGLLGIKGDSVRSRESILLSNILSNQWKQGKDVDLLSLITLIQTPPFAQIGALNIEAFFPSKERFELAMSVNNLLASPGFESWLKGAPLDISQFLYAASGKPRIAIFSVAHLNDDERMFFVTLLLEQVLSWMRAQPGTTSLRAILYMDEIFGYFPPVANPPSKEPLLTLLKQARAFGLGVLLATQNPVDLDYKGLSNCGTWFIGRLQTERDKMRLIDGLEGAAAGTGQKFDRSAITELLAGLGKRVFLMNNVHDDAPTLFETRWTLSYLRGPLAKSEIKKLTAASAAASPAASTVTSTVEGDAKRRRLEPANGAKPVIPPDIQEFFLPATKTADITYTPMILGVAGVRYTDTKTSLDYSRDSVMLTPIDATAAIHVDWDKSKRANITPEHLSRQPAPNATFAPLPGPAGDPKSYAAWSKDFTNWLYANRELKLFKSPSTELSSQPGETERDFRIRLQQAAREKRDQELEKLKNKYSPKLASAQEKLRHAEETLQREQREARDHQMESAISIGSTLLGAVMGRRSASIYSIESGARAMNRASRAQDDVGRAQANVQAYNQQLQELEQQFQRDTQAISSSLDPLNEKLEELVIRPKKGNITPKLLALVWVPN